MKDTERSVIKPKMLRDIVLLLPKGLGLHKISFLHPGVHVGEWHVALNLDEEIQIVLQTGEVKDRSMASGPFHVTLFSQLLSLEEWSKRVNDWAKGSDWCSRQC